MKKFINHPKIHCKSWNFVIEKINKMQLEKLHIVADFDNTMTSDNDYTSWALFKASKLMPKEYNIERDKQFSFYHPKELDNSLSNEEKNKWMKEWWNSHLNLFVKYKLSKSTLRSVVSNNKFMKLRWWMERLLRFSNQNNIPFVILSAWVGNTISLFMKYNNYLTDNIHIVSTNLLFDENEICIGIENKNIIHINNKDEWHIPQHVESLLEKRKDVILLGDSMSDLKMVNENNVDNLLKIAYLIPRHKHDKQLYIDKFDIVIESKEDSLGVLDSIIKQLSKNN